MPDAELLAELEELRERLDRCQPIPVPWVDGHQCLQHALAQCLRLPPAQVPERRDFEDIDAWDRRVADQLGVRLELIHFDEPPPSDEWWVAVLPASVDDTRTHAVGVFGNSAAARGRLAGFRVRAA